MPATKNHQLIRGELVLRTVSNSVENLTAAFISLALSVIYLFDCPLQPWINGSTGIDSSVFLTVAMMMEKGYMPYRDSFDHKGPFLYILNYLGNKLSYYNGTWFIEVVFLAITFFILYKIARLLAGRAASVITVLISISLLFTYLGSGNYSEEYAMPFIAAAVYIFMDYLLNERLTAPRVALSGTAFGLVLMLRANMIAVWIVFCLYIFVKLIIAGKYKTLFAVIAEFLFGTLLAILPMLVWLSARGALADFWEDYILFNTLYSSEGGGRAVMAAKWEAFIKFTNSTVFLLSFFSILYHSFDKEKRSVHLAYAAYMILTILLMIMSGMDYPHYGLVLVPAAVYPLSLIFLDAESIREESVRRAFLSVITLYALSVLIMPKWLDHVKAVPDIVSNRNKAAYAEDEELSAVLELIADNSDKNDSICVYGNWNIVYVLSQRKHATRYSYLVPIGIINPKIMDEYWAQLEEEQPSIVIIPEGRHYEQIENYVDRNSYKLLWTKDETNAQSLTVYKK